MPEITHRPDKSGVMRQIVSPEHLRAILRQDHESLKRPSWFGPNDEWDVGPDEPDEVCDSRTGESDDWGCAP